MSLLRTRLSVMMFLEFFIWGAWFPLVFKYVPDLGKNGWDWSPLPANLINTLGLNGWEATFILSAFPVSALIAVFFSNQFADRTFSAEKFLAVSQLIGGAAILGIALLPLPGKAEPAMFWPIFGLMLVHTLLYVPTISITNSIAFANMPNSRDFGFVRLWGTIGWIAAAWPFAFILVDWKNVPTLADVGFISWLRTALGTGKHGEAELIATNYTFVAAGGASLLLAAFSLVLPHTPPKKSGETLAWLEAVKLLRHPFILVLFVVTFLDSAVHQFYFVWSARFLTEGVKLPVNWVMPVMSIGQVAEIVTMALLALVLKRLGWRWTMILGILGHAARFSVFAFAQKLPQEWQQPAAISVNVLHGICYAFFFATVYIFIEDYFPKDARTSAQGLFNMLILGLGPIFSNFISGKMVEKDGRFNQYFTTDGKTLDFQAIFLVPLTAALFAATLLLLFFHPPTKKAEA
jgi:nucleoside transporter